MENTNKVEATPHALTLEGRRKAMITGVTELVSFSDQMVVLATGEGALTLLGNGLHVGQLSLADGRLAVDGEISALEYEGARRGARGGFFSRLVR